MREPTETEAHSQKSQREQNHLFRICWPLTLLVGFHRTILVTWFSTQFFVCELWAWNNVIGERTLKGWCCIVGPARKSKQGLDIPVVPKTTKNLPAPACQGHQGCWVRQLSVMLLAIRHAVVKLFLRSKHPVDPTRQIMGSGFVAPLKIHHFSNLFPTPRKPEKGSRGA